MGVVVVVVVVGFCIRTYVYTFIFDFMQKGIPSVVFLFFEIRFFILFVVVVEVILLFLKKNRFLFHFLFLIFPFCVGVVVFFIDVCGLMGILGGSDVSVALALWRIK